MKSVLIVEDHPLVAEATGKLLENLSEELDLVFAGTASDAVRLLSDRSWFRIFLDLDVPGAYGLSLAREVERHGLAPVCCIVSALNRSDYIHEAKARSFAGYLVKAAPIADFAGAVGQVLAGVSTFPTFNEAKREPPIRLTRRQLEILDRVRGGESSKEIARAIHITEGTINNHMTAIMHALGAASRTAAVVRAIELGLLGPLDGRLQSPGKRPEMA